MLKKFFAFFAAAALTVCMAGCSDYVMTEEDLAIQKSLVGYWAADVSTGYNEFSENGELTAMTAVEFTDDFHYLMHICLIEQGYALTYPPVSYSFEDRKFKVVNEGVASFAQVSVSDDGQIMYWHTDEKTDTYRRLDAETAAGLGIPEYSAESWVTDENGDYINETAPESSAAENQGTENSIPDNADTESEAGTVSETES